MRSYLGRVTKARIIAAVREALGDEAAERIADKKKVDMAQAAERLLAGTGWLPPLLRTERPAWLAEPDAPVMVAGMPEGDTVEDEPLAVAAE